MGLSKLKSGFWQALFLSGGSRERSFFFLSPFQLLLASCIPWLVASSSVFEEAGSIASSKFPFSFTVSHSPIPHTHACPTSHNTPHRLSHHQGVVPGTPGFSPPFPCSVSELVFPLLAEDSIPVIHSYPNVHLRPVHTRFSINKEESRE